MIRIFNRYRNNFLRRGLRKINFCIEDVRCYFAKHKFGSYHADFTKFIILTRSRSGSNLITSFLESHPDIYIRGEILGKRRNRPIRLYLDRFFRYQPKSVKSSGFKIFYYHPIDDSTEEVWEELLKIPDLRVIHLKRRNLFNVAVSREKAILTGFWSSSEGLLENYQFEMKAENCLKLFEETRGWEESFDKKFSNNAILEIVYEDFVENTSAHLQRIQEFLNLSHFPLTTFRKKQQSQPNSITVSNYKDLKKYFEGSEWGGFFE